MSFTKSLTGLSAIKFCISFSVLAAVSRELQGFNFLYYSILALFSYFIFKGIKFLFTDKSLRLLVILITAFGIWAAVTSLWSDYPLISLARAAYFIFISIGAVLGGYLWNNVNEIPSLDFLLPANILVILLCLFSLITYIPSNAWTGGHGKGFMGFGGHQNTLASMILFTVPGAFSFLILNPQPKAFKIVNRKSKIINSFTLLLLLLNLVILSLTYSRASILSVLIILVIFFFLIYKWKALLVYISILTVLAVMFFLSTSFRDKAEELLLKNFPNLFFSREILFVPSYNAALNGGLFGLGYGISDPGIEVPGTGSHYENGRYIREKGNSALALVEEVGLIGLVLFLLPLFYVIKKLTSDLRSLTSDLRPLTSGFQQQTTNNKQQTTNLHLLFSVIISLIIYAQFEAWWVGPGSIHLPLFFMILGNAVAGGRVQRAEFRKPALNLFQGQKSGERGEWHFR